MKRLIFAILILVSCAAFGQENLSGVVRDSLTGQPLPFATVYINGTTNGTTTNEDGVFNLEKVSFPSTLVMSFMGYETQAVYMPRNPGVQVYELPMRLNMLAEVVVMDDNTWNDDLDYFRRLFLGDDKWGRGANIRNEEVLSFDRSQSVMEIPLEISAGVHIMKMRVSTFTATASSPLVIDLPLLGYELTVNLEDFSITNSADGHLCNILGYYYYKPYEFTDLKQKEKIMNNRRTVYYGSSQHFLRSLYSDNLEQNGYSIRKPGKGTNGIVRLDPHDLPSHTTMNGNGTMSIQGLKDMSIRILYYAKHDGTPLNRNNRIVPSLPDGYSSAIFQNDTCVILKDGTIPDYGILFKGDMAEKKVGASLPADYTPDE